MSNLTIFLQQLPGLLTGSATFLVAIRSMWTLRKGQRDAATTLQNTNDKTHSQLVAIHTLVNNNMAIQLRVSAMALRRVATLTGHPDDIKAAEDSETALARHLDKQAEVDAAIASRII